MSEYQKDIATSAASEHVTNVLEGVVNAGGGYAQNATQNIGAKIGKLERQKAKMEIQKVRSRCVTMRRSWDWLVARST